MSAGWFNTKTALLTLGVGVALAGCSKRDPKIDTAAPVISPAPSAGPGGVRPGAPGYPYNSNNGNRVNPPAVIPGGPGTLPGTLPGGNPSLNRPYTPNFPNTPGVPLNNNNNNNIRPPVTPPIAPPVLPPSRPNIIPNPPVVPIQPPGSMGASVSVSMQMVLTADGPKVKAAVPANVTGLKMQYLGVAGMTEGTTVDVSVSFTSGNKACSLEKATVGAESQTFTVPCK